MPKSSDSPLRQCMATRESCPKEELLRFVVSPENKLVFDLKQNLPGRGFYVKPDKRLVKEMLTKQLRHIRRKVETDVEASADLPEQVAAQLRACCLRWLGLAKRAGEAIPGADAIREARQKKPMVMVLHAVEASEKEVARLESPNQSVLSVQRFTTEELSQALGREHAVHVGLLKGGTAANMLHYVQLYERYES